MINDCFPNSSAGYQLNVKLTNLTEPDFKFLSTIIQFFSDPANDALVDRIRSGAFGLQYEPGTGAPHVCDLNPDAALPPGAMVEFFARFSEADWKKLKPHKAELVKHFLAGKHNAELYAKRVLGHLPKPVKLKFCSE